MNPFTTFRFALAALLLACAPAHAQLFRAYLSFTGSDANPCTVAAPCRLLPAALNAVADGGEIWMLNSANYNTSTVNVGKSVTILAIPGAVGSIVATGTGDGMAVNGAGIRVTLRNLVFVRIGSARDAISFQVGAELNVRDCEIQGAERFGINAASVDSQLNVSNTVVRGSGAVGIAVTTGLVALSGVQVAGSPTGVSVGGMGTLVMTGSVIASNDDGVTVLPSGTSTARANVDRSVFSGNGTAVSAYAIVAGTRANVTLTRSAISHSDVAVYANQISGTTTIVVGANVIAENGIAFLFSGDSTIFTREDNTLRFNGFDFVDGALTPLAPI